MRTKEDDEIKSRRNFSDVVGEQMKKFDAKKFNFKIPKTSNTEQTPSSSADAGPSASAEAATDEPVKNRRYNVLDSSSSSDDENT